MLTRKVLKFAIIVGIAYGAVGGASAAWASTTLKKVQVTDGSQIDLFFDGKVNPSQVRTEYFNDIIQLSLDDVSVYPAKISSYSGMELTKIFAYQYAPKLVRCRLSVKGKAEDYQKRVEVKANGKVLSIRIKPAESVAASSQERPKAAEPEKTAEEAALLARVLKSETAEKPSEKPSKNSKASKASSGEQQSEPLASGKPLPSPFRSMMMLGLVMTVFGGFAFLLKKVKNGPSLINHKGFAGAISKFAKGSLGRKGKMIEVVATHYLGPKKSIAMVRVGGRILVLGVTNESINLITQLSGEVGGDELDLEKLALGENAGPDPSEAIAQALFAQPAAPKHQPKASPAQVKGPSLTGAIAKNAYAAGAVAGAQAPKASTDDFSEILNRENAKPSVRAQIRSRLEGMKQL